VKNLLFILIFVLIGCYRPQSVVESYLVKPKFVTDSVAFDSDDPAIWINLEDLTKSLILGTDKHEVSGGLYVFDLKGKADTSITVKGLDRPNNVDIAYGFNYMDTIIDVAVCSERGTGSIRVFRLPDLFPIDGGGIPVFEDDTINNKVMGVALYKRPSDQAIFAILSRKEFINHDHNYLYQYRLYADSLVVKAELVRKFGDFSGTKEIEAIAVDNELGFVYYSDEAFGIRKYYADPNLGNQDLAVFGLNGFTDDREGISIYKYPNGTGFILVSDQGANRFRVFPREGTENNPHDHPEISFFDVSAMSSDGSEVSAFAFGEDFPNGVFVAMSDNRTFEIYDWRDVLNAIKRNGK